MAVIEFRVFGTLDLRGGDGVEIRSLLAQPKRIALLAYLAVASPRGFHRRDKLLPLFWPEADQDHARTSLRKAIHILRQALGESVVLSRGDEEIGLDFTAISSDVAVFEQALEAGAGEQALALYGGDLLSGLHVPESPDFERWLDMERYRLRQRAGEAARELARREEQGVGPSRAAQWRRRALDLCPYDESDLQALVRLLDRIGDRAGAIRAYDLFARHLAQDLEVEPSPETQALIEEIRSRAAYPRAAPASPTVVEAAQPVASSRRSPSPARWLVVGAVTAAVLTAGLLRVHVGFSAGKADARVVAVTPFRMSGADPFLAFLRLGMVDLLAAKLSGTDHLRPIDPRTLLARWTRAGGTDTRDLEHSEALVVARDLGAGWLLEGAVTGTAQRVTLSAVASDVTNGSAFRASVEAPYDSLSASIDRLAAELLALGAGEPRHRLAALMSTSLPALRLYLEGMSELRRGAYADAVRHFDEALEIDTTFAAAGIGRTNAAIWLGEDNLGSGSLRAWAHRERLAARDRASLRFMLGPKYPHRSTGREWLAAAEELVKAAPDDPQAWATVGDQTYHYGRLVGIPDAAERSLRAYRRALVLDSTYLPGWEHVGEILLLAGDTVEARRSIRLRLRQDSLSPLATEDLWLGRRLLGDTTLPDLPLDRDSLVSRPNGITWKAVQFSRRLADADTVVERTWRGCRAQAIAGERR
jgi:DNA-binding SARP family transcriptional activator